jgi:uncharacterized protein
MTNIDSYKSGSFCWVELGTTDQTAAKKFYGSLFGWQATDLPMGPSGTYTFFKLNGRDAGAGYQLSKEMLDHHVPPHWMLYISVASADAASEKIKQAGGKIEKGPFDVFDVGRMSVCSDPSGAHFCIWQAKGEKANGVGEIDGSFCWADLNTPDPAAAGKFYSQVFGWQIVEDRSGKGNPDYKHIKNGENFIGGIPPVRPDNPRLPAHWLTYFLTSDCKGLAAKAKQLGAKAILEPMFMEEVGTIAILSDPQGAVFALYQALKK